MAAHRSDCLIIVTVTVGVATAGLGLPTSKAAGIASIPDFSGLWAHPSLPGFEPPRSGPGPVVNKSRRAGVSNFNQLVGDYTNPILKPAAAEIVKKHGDISLAGVGYPTPSNQCWPGGLPYAFSSVVMQMLQQPDEITILYSRDHEVRHVRLNAPHPARVKPSWFGDSVGHYEGDALVIDTIGLKSGPFSMVDMYGTPHSPALHVVERYRLLDYEDAKEGLERDARENFRIPVIALQIDPDYRGKNLQLQFTVDDQGVFTMPWSATITYRRGTGEWQEDVCAENPQHYPGKFAEVPSANKPDF